jgi:hypothetical protein
MEKPLSSQAIVFRLNKQPMEKQENQENATSYQ